MIIWVDDVRAPAARAERTIWCKSTNAAIAAIKDNLNNDITLIDLDHDAGDYANDGGDYIHVLDWLDKYELSIPIHIHSMNPVGRQNMLAIAKKNHWMVIP